MSNPYITKMQYKYQCGQRVRCINPDHEMYGQCGVIDRAMPYVFEHSAYDVRFDGTEKVTAMSERSLEALQLWQFVRAVTCIVMFHVKHWIFTLIA